MKYIVEYDIMVSIIIFEPKIKSSMYSEMIAAVKG